MLFKLAFRNVKRQINDYLVYFITVSLTVALVFSVDNFTFSDILFALSDYDSFLPMLFFCGASILCAVIAFVLGYVTAFLLRKRKKEFGLYLTMGMSRRNILLLFAGETAVNFLLALGMGILLGLGIYQVLIAVFTRFSGGVYSPQGYSPLGILVTIVMVGVMYAVSALASLLYLRSVKISRLLHGEQTVEKRGKRPLIWLVIFLVAAVLSAYFFIGWYASDNFFEPQQVVKAIVLGTIFFTSIFFLPVSLSRALLPLLLRNKKRAARGASTFTLGQLSSRITGNSTLIGVLTLLLSIAFVAPNLFLNTYNQINLYCDESQEYDFSYSIREDNADFSEEIFFDTVEKYVKIDRHFEYFPYSYRTETPWAEMSEEERFLCNIRAFVRESDFKALCDICGYEYTMPALNGEYLLCRIELYKGGAYDETPPERIEMGGESFQSVGVAYYPSDNVLGLFTTNGSSCPTGR